MICDLTEHGEDVTIAADVGVVGAGIAGLILATRLASAGLRVVVLESGGRWDLGPADPLKQVVQAGRIYKGAMEGRARCLGGTSTMWGGALIPFVPEDMDARYYPEKPEWPVSFREVAPYAIEVEELFGLAGTPYNQVTGVAPLQIEPETEAGSADFRARYAKWPTFRRRNLAFLLKDEIEKSKDLIVWLNASLIDFSFDPDTGGLSTLEARSPRGKRLRLKARCFALCPGAIEATRLLLWLDRRSGHLTRYGGALHLGRYFHDHLSARLAAIETSDPTTLNRLAGFRFDGRTMRSLRFEFRPEAQARDAAPAGFVHLSFRPIGPSGFEHLRDLLRSIQRGRLDWNPLKETVRHLPYLSKAAYWRAVHKQLYWPQPAAYDVNFVLEQAPRQENRISLADETDSMGVPRAAINWQIDEGDISGMRNLAARFKAFWETSGLRRYGRLVWRSDPDLLSLASMQDLADIYHPGGTTRMAHSRAHGVVDKDLAVFGLNNLFVASTSTFPSGGVANPTMMLAMFALRLAEKIRSEVGH